MGDAISSSDPTKTWKVINSLNGSPNFSSPNEAIVHNGRTITDQKQKANIFVNHYARVSNISLTSTDRDLVRHFMKRLDQPSATADSCSPIQMSVLKAAISRVKRKGAAGPDNIPPTFLKALGTRALTELLAIFNSSFDLADCPRIWRIATIIPILKAGKSAKEVASYRPISLTSCVVKLLERILEDRLYLIAETSNLLTKFQAGFRRGRSCEDQILRITQAIEDGFQHKPMHRSVLGLLDFSKAYDTVWREKLLLHMLHIGIPLHFIKWLKSFLTDRRSRVMLHNTNSISRVFQQGLPQGSVLAPLLFLFYINSLADHLPDDVLLAMFADDVSLLTTARNRTDAESTLQTAISSVVDWSHEWKLQLNTDKCEVSPFSTWTNDGKWAPTITINDKILRVNPTPRMLGVILDRSLTFNAHLDSLVKSLSSNINALKTVSHTTWGWRKSSVRTLFYALVRSKLDYAAPAWQPWLSNTNMDRLERLQNKGLRIISGQLISTPVEALRSDTGVSSYRTTSNRKSLCAREKALRSEPDHPKRIIIETAVQQRLASRSSWRRQVGELAVSLPPEVSNRKPIRHFTTPPWATSIPSVTVHNNLADVIGRNASAEDLKSKSLEVIRSATADIVIYTDGSADAGTRNGGSAMVATRGDPAGPTIITTMKKRGSQLTCSYEEEVEAMLLALNWIADNNNYQGSRVLICTDSKSLCDAILSFNKNLQSSLDLLASRHFYLLSSFSGFQVTSTFRETKKLIKQRKKQLPSLKKIIALCPSSLQSTPSNMSSKNLLSPTIERGKYTVG